MTQEEIAVFKQSILDAIENYVNIKLSDLPTMKSDIAVVLGNGTKEGNKLKIRNAEYDNIMSVGNIVFPENSIVYTLAPNGQYNQLFILGQLSDTPANIVGGTIDIGNGAFTVDEDGNVDVTGTVNFSDKLLVDNQGNLSITDGTIDISGKFIVEEDGSVTITEGTINLGTGNFVVDSNGQVTIKSGSINIGNGSFVVNSSGQVTASNLNITGGGITLNNGKFVISNDGTLTLKDNLNRIACRLSTSGVVCGLASNTTYTSMDYRGLSSGTYFADNINLTGEPFRLYGGMISGGYTVDGLDQYLLSGSDYEVATWGTAPCFYMFVETPDGGTTKHTVITVPSSEILNYTLDIQLPYVNFSGIPTFEYGANFPVGSTAFFRGSTISYGTESHNGVAYFNNTVYDSNGGTVFVSDRNAKHDIETLDLKESTDFIMAQNPVKYRFNEELSNSNRYHHGFIAQEVKETMGENDWGLYIDQAIKEEDNDSNYTKGLRYNEFIADLVATCQYQQKEIEQQQEKIEDLQSQINELKALIQNKE